MKPNGRRGWRKWAKRRRLRMNAHHRALYTGAKMRKKRDAIERAPLPAREFSPRSLVGMTMGSRKRAARVEAIWNLWSWGYASPESDHPGWKTALSTSRAKYRLGERLRPCLVCQWAKCKLPCRDCSTCDGSGVLPAKRHRLECGIDYSAGKDWSVRLTAEYIGWDCQKCGTLIHGDELELPTAVCLCGVGEGLWMRAHAVLSAGERQ